MTDDNPTPHRGARNDLTAEYVRSILDYDPETGELRWRVSMRPRAKKGAIAGWQQPSGRRKVSIKARAYMAHRLIWLIQTGAWPEHEIDHHDLNQSNNRWDNLRETTPSQNQANRPTRRNSTTGITGVCWDSIHENWLAYINKRPIGHFHKFENAVMARKKAEKRTHGEFSYS